MQSTVAQIDQLDDGARQVADGSASVASGAATAADGASALADGAASAASGAAQLRDGSAQLRDGAAQLDSGIAQLSDGATQLRDGLAAGVEQIPDSDDATRQAQAAAISDPVAVGTSAVTKAQNYGAGLAPFFAALAGWIGIYALFLIVKPVSKRAITALRSPVRVTLAGWLTPAGLGALQMVGLFTVLAIALQFSFANPWAALGILLFASATYAAIVLALNVWLGSVGQFLGLVLMVLQLVTAGGTFPWQTLPAPWRRCTTCCRWDTSWMPCARSCTAETSRGSARSARAGRVDGRWRAARRDRGDADDASPHPARPAAEPDRLTRRPHLARVARFRRFASLPGDDFWRLTRAQRVTSADAPRTPCAPVHSRPRCSRRGPR